MGYSLQMSIAVFILVYFMFKFLFYSIISPPNSITMAIVVPDGTVNIAGYTYAGRRNFTSISLPNSVRTIGTLAFADCREVTSVNLPEGLISTEAGAFANCGITSLTIPSTMTRIYDSFSGCPIASLTINVVNPANFTVFSLRNVGYSPPPVSSVSVPDNANWRAYSAANAGKFYGLTINYSPPPAGSPPCFPAGTRLLTNNGNKAVETLTTDDRIITADGRSVPFKLYSTVIEKTTEASAPYHIPAGTFGNKAITLSPLHAIQSSKGVWQIPCDAAKQFAGIRQVNLGERVEYFHVELPNFFTDNIVAEGNVVESFAAKQTKGIKHIYTQNAKLNGYTRVSPAAKKALTL